MQEHIHPQSSAMIEAQKAVIKEMLDDRRKRGEIKSDSEYQSEWNMYMEKLGVRPLFTTVREQGEMIDANLHNETFEEIGLDLSSAYKQVNEISETVNKHQRLNQSMINHLKLRLKRVENDLTKCERLIDIQDTGSLHYETFIDSNSFETDYTYYTERNGMTVPVDYHARWDTENEALKLPIAGSQNGLIGAGGVQLGRLTIRKQLGSNVTELRNSLQTIGKAIDTDPESYWAETISMDAPIEVAMGSEYYDIKFGALVELMMDFDYLTPINEIGFTMFGEYPVDIVSIQYYETDNENEEPKELVFPDSSIPELQSRSIDGSTAFQFPDIMAKRLRILLNQRHYVKKDLILSGKEQRNLQLWLSARSDQETKQIAIDEYDVDHVIERFNEDHREAVTKYQYQYGLYECQVKRNEYHNAGVYVSRAIPLSQNVKTVRLETLEDHPRHAHPLKLTDIEYYVHDGKNWYPILPMNQKDITGELLSPTFSQGRYTAKTRFKVEGGVLIRKNGIPIENSVALLPDQETILFNEYDASAYYTVDYLPVEGCWMIDFLKKYEDATGEVRPNKRSEEKRGTDSKGRITLIHPPFVDKTKWNMQEDGYDPSFLENEYVPITVKMIDGNGYHIAQPMNSKESGIAIYNVTDYEQTGQSNLKPYGKEAPVYQYEVIGNDIQFNTVIPESTRIIVEYPYLVSEIRVKAILRRNIPGFHGLTPVLEDYIVHFQTLV